MKQDKIKPQVGSNEYYWSIFGIACAVLAIALIAIFLIIRIMDGSWGNWQLPAILTVIYFALVTIGAMIFSLREIKQQTSKQVTEQK